MCTHKHKAMLQLFFVKVTNDNTWHCTDLASTLSNGPIFGFNCQPSSYGLSLSLFDDFKTVKVYFFFILKEPLSRIFCDEIRQGSYRYNLCKSVFLLFIFASKSNLSHPINAHKKDLHTLFHIS